ncbi:MAG TPA: flippase [Stenomitos sp.]
MLGSMGRLKPGRAQVVSNAAWLWLEQVFRLSIGLFVGVWVARYLGPQQFGAYSYALAFVALFGPIARMGLDSLVIRDIAREPESKDEVLGTTFLLKAVGGGVATTLAIAVILGLNHGDGATCAMVALIALGFVFQPFDVINLYFTAQQQQKFAVAAKTTAYVLVNLLKLWLIMRMAPLSAFALTSLAETGLAACCLLVGYRTAGERIRRWRFSAERARATARESWPLILSGLTFLLYSKIDQVMLGALTTKTELAFYAVAVKLAEVTDFIPLILQTLFLPRLSGLYKDRPAEYRRHLQVYFDLMLVTWLGVAIVISVAASPLVAVMYGATYAPAAAILAVYAWGQFGSNLGIARGTLLTVEGKVHLNFYIQALGALFNILLNLFAIPRFGALGATVATLLTNLLVAVALNAALPDLRAVWRLIIRACHLRNVAQRVSQAVWG